MKSLKLIFITMSIIGSLIFIGYFSYCNDLVGIIISIIILISLIISFIELKLYYNNLEEQIMLNKIFND